MSRGEKLKAMAEFEVEAKKSKYRKTLLWVSGIAAVFVVGFFAINPLFVYETPSDAVRGDDNVFEITTPNDSIKNDTITNDSLTDNQ